MTITQSAWTGMMSVDDTALYVTDTGGPGRPVVYLNGAYADQSHWRRVIADLGLAARMTADQHADVNIELNEIAAASVPVLERVTCPVRFLLATGDSLGSQAGEMEQGRTILDPVLAGNPNVKVSAKVASNHSKILRKDSPAVADAVRELAATRGHAVG